MRMLDLSITLESDPSPLMNVEIKYLDHKHGTKEYNKMGIKTEDLPLGLAYADDEVESTTHGGTHMDSPWHFHPTCAGKPARTIDEIPIDWCFGEGICLDFHDRPNGTRLEIEDIRNKLSEAAVTLKPGNIVLFYTGAMHAWGREDFWETGCGPGRDATLWMIEQGIHMMGTDAWSFDRPYKYWIADYKETGDKALIWEAHLAGIEKEYCHLEKLTNLDRLPPSGFKVACFPIKIKKASAGFVRAVAMFEDE